MLLSISHVFWFIQNHVIEDCLYENDSCVKRVPWGRCVNRGHLRFSIVQNNVKVNYIKAQANEHFSNQHFRLLTLP